MAECFDEFDEATTLRKTFCSRVSVEDYEQQTTDTTEEAIAQLLAHLDNNPQAYYRVLQAKKSEDVSIFSYIKNKLFSYFSGSPGMEGVSEEECVERLDTLKRKIIKSFNYSQESRGHRFSKRLVDRQLRREIDSVATPTRGLPPPPPPLPPSLPPTRPRRKCAATPIVHATLTRRPLSRTQAHTKKQSANVPSDIISQLKGSECKKRLRPVSARSPDCRKRKQSTEEENIPFFNAMLLKKFKNTNTHSPSFTMASPGSFESPLGQATPPTLPTHSPLTPLTQSTAGEDMGNSPVLKNVSIDKENAPMDI